MENYFGIFVIFGNWNHRKRRPTWTTIHKGAPQAPSAWWLVIPSSNISWISTLGLGNLISGKKLCKKISAIGVTDLQEYKKRFSARSEERETEENREGDPISEGLPPIRNHGDQGPEGELSSHLGGGQGRISRGLSPPRFRWRQSATGAMIRTTIYINNLATVNTNFLPLYAAV